MTPAQRAAEFINKMPLLEARECMCVDGGLWLATVYLNDSELIKQAEDMGFRPDETE
jgi:hypothetical protein